ncbi:MAG: hypothetical protein HY834_16635 [Devosia nanyangense]|uniref:Uncharacterized protein n=1 Tax=Devosia nanyangense TaxID=1228055 RepID=A0A933L370_9HYPH|nr:hypothetical protein [Devosia nanyangense]
MSGVLRGLLLAIATAAAAFGLLVVVHPFSAPAPVAGSIAADPADTAAAQARIEAARAALRQTEAALDNVKGEALSVTPAVPDTGLRAQYEAQIAAATERRDLALRHASAIRDGLAAGLPVSSLAEIRDSVMVGQLLSQQAALEARIAEQGARLKATHPVMRALLAQRGTLAAQIAAEAASIATALEAEARMDDAQIKLLESQLTPLPAEIASSPPVDTAGLETQAAAQRADLDALVDAYFDLKPATATSTPAANPLTPLNLLVAGIAGLVALAAQLVLAARLRRAGRAEAADLAAWQVDGDRDILSEPVPVTEEDPALRRAS